ncbi:MAG: amidohydrolase family protein [Oscillospiraceae bacterium]|nr:amidohydrolase family protein [Oscillospiraceae bacterium]
MIIYNARVMPVSSGEFTGYVTIEDGKITDIGTGAPAHISDGDIDAKGNILMPGLIDIHTHLGFIGDGAGDEGIDVNEGSSPVTPQLRAIDGINYFDGYFKDAVKAGITCVVTGVGSLNAIGGDMIAVKTYGRYLDEALIGTVGIKFALGENPKMYYTERDEAPQTRMATAALIRETLYKARQYAEQKNAAEGPDDMPDFELKYEALIPLLEGNMKAHIHCHRADDILTALRLCEEFSLTPLLIHCTEGHLIADILAEKGAEAVVGPVICDRGKPELAHADLKNAGILYNAGVKVALCTDHPEVQIDFLPASAAFCVKNGLPKDAAVRAMTLTAAELGGFADRCGSIERGKDADLIITDGDPLDINTRVLLTMVNGNIAYNAF